MDNKENIIIGSIAVVAMIIIIVGAILLSNKRTATYEVIFDSKGGTAVEKQIIKKGNKVIKPKDPQKEGYVFVEWAYEGKTYDFRYVVSKNLLLEAKWEEYEENIQYIVIFNTDGGSYVEEQSVEEGNVVIKPEDPQKEGYRFIGWFLEDEEYNFETKVDQDIELIAKWEEKLYTVTFDSNGGSKIEEQIVQEGKNVIKPEEPKKEGYLFVEWIYNEESYDFSLGVSGDIKLTAKWAKNEETTQKITIKFNSDGGSTVSNQIITKGNRVTKPKDPVKEGYIFKGWYNNNVKFDFSKSVTSNITLVAKWEKRADISYTVTFNSNGGSAVAKQTIKEGRTVTKPTNPKKTGYTFVEWQLNGKKYDFSTKVTKHIELKAVWKKINKYVVTFDSNGGSSVSSKTVTSGSSVSKPTTPTRSGYTFVEWQLNGSKYDFNTPVTSNITLVAKWNQTTHTVTFNSNGGTSVSSKTVASGSTVSKPTAPTRTGYTFVEWQLNGKVYDFSSKVTSDITLIAKWKKTYTVTFKYSEGNVITQTIITGNKVTRPTNPTKSGYTFSGWYNGNVEYDFDTPVTSNITLVAKWKAKTYTVTFNSNGGSSVSSQTVMDGDKVSKPTDPTLSGYKFVGWFFAGEEYDFDTPVTSNLTLYAEWDGNVSYTVTYDSNGGSFYDTTAKTYTIVTEKGKKAPQLVVYRDGYKFAGWELNGWTYDFKTPVTSDITLKATWWCTITFDSNGGTDVSNKTILCDTVSGKLSEPTKDGYEFVGWYLDGSKYYISYPVTKHITLKAKWQEK